MDREITERDDRRLSHRLRQARLRQNACLEDLDFSANRGLDKALINSLQDSQWIKKHRNILITGPTGVGKSWIACALAQKACRDGYTALYQRLPRLFNALPLAKGGGSYSKLLTRFAKIDVLLLDDWGLTKMTAEQRRDLLEILEDRYGSRSKNKKLGTDLFNIYCKINLSQFFVNHDLKLEILALCVVFFPDQCQDFGKLNRFGRRRP